ncbi:MAG: hypothetical protein Q9165_004010 [Trypethelium subeluteriae]
MDIVQTVSGYISKMIAVGDSSSTSGAAKMKILLLDADTASLEMFNIVKKSSLERLAEADDHEVVRAILEYFADYLVINPDLMSLDLGYPKQRIWSSSPDQWNADALQRTTEGVIALLLSLKKKPLIRYAKTSLLAKKLASEVRYQMTQEEQLFDFRKADTPPILLIVDRREDPLTPLLTQWAYQAMVHEMLGIDNGRVDLSHVPDVRPELKEIVLSQDQDPFFKKNMYLNFGDLGQNAKEYVEQFASKTQSNAKLDSIADMKQFVEEYPEFRRLSGNVTKHVTLVTELSRRVEQDNLLDVSELEQSLACNDNHSNDLKTLQKLIANPSIPADNKLRLVAIYALRYASNASNSTPMLLDLLAAVGSLSRHRISLIPTLLSYASSLHHGPSSSSSGVAADLFQPGTFFAGARDRLNRGLKGVENVYTQHSPKLEATLQDLIRGRLDTGQYPFLEGGAGGGGGSGTGGGGGRMATREKPQDVVVFVVGGATYEEARMVAQVNASSPGVRVVLGGTTVHRSASFLEEVEDAVGMWPQERSGDVGERLRREVGRS